MNFKKIKPYVVSVIIALAVGALSGIATSKGLPSFEKLIKPPLTPPSALFPIVWTVLYFLMGIGAAIIWKSSDEGRSKALKIYTVQLLFNALWSVLFFSLKVYCISFLWLIVLWILILMMVVSFYRISKTAGLIQIPYLIWVAFAGYLNLAICLLNR